MLSKPSSSQFTIPSLRTLDILTGSMTLGVTVHVSTVTWPWTAFLAKLLK